MNDPEDREPNDWRRRDRDWNDYVAHESWLESQGYHRPNRPDQVQIMLGLDPVGYKTSPTETDGQCDS